MTNFQIPMHQSSKAFEECWLAAGRHLASQIDTGTLSFFSGVSDPTNSGTLVFSTRQPNLFCARERRSGDSKTSL